MLPSVCGTGTTLVSTLAVPLGLPAYLTRAQPLIMCAAADGLTNEQQKDFRQAVDTFGVQSARAQVWHG